MIRLLFITFIAQLVTFYCILQQKKFKNCSVLRRKCKEMFDISFTSSNLFVKLSLKHQLETLLERLDVRKHLSEALRLGHVVHDSEYISDIPDGKLHKNLMRYDPEILSFNMSLDGAPAHNAKTGFWPHSAILNDFPPKIRFKTILLASVVVVKEEPSHALLNLVLDSFVEECNELSTDGVEIIENGEKIKLRFAPLCCPIDSAARPVIQNRAKYNAFYGCSYCRLRGKHADGAVKFPYIKKPVLRLHEANFGDVFQLLT
ncbi:uncharacterized protein LOC117166989 [Belonocnema kinseyi]|uniref:uncharacterized protein LOC117166989 n=1 Tax=Belonocnema kinseyi TaxID=2817044 RepID=UPI00143DF0CE|nr:uncharacterized protein LOC117166989 [Belonocnema kinseyi]